ncbi:MAG: cbb3-type cytochrome c oxidase subunit I [Planctomycetota bacterium]
MKGLKWGAILSFIISMAVLLLGGYFSMDKLAPYPEKVVVNGKVLFDKAELLLGQDAYQKHGLMDHGSVWGHGTLRGMDFSATTIHLMVTYIAEFYNKPENASYNYKSSELGIENSIIAEIKENRYNAKDKSLELTASQAYALEKIKNYWKNTFKNGDKDYGFLPDTIKEEAELNAIGSFFFWTAWVASTNRPGEVFTYTNNWPPDKQAGNTLMSEAFIWSVISIVGLLAVLGLIIYIVHRYRFFYGEPKGVSIGRELINLPITSSQLKAAKFFVVVIGLFILQTLMGGLLAHYTTHPGTFYIPIIGKFIPYSWAKTWHLQLAIFWIATSWVGTAIYVAPLISGKEPKGQGLLVNLLFGAIIFVALGSLAGGVLGIKGLLGNSWFWFGHQGWEYLELGRVWQILLFAGLIFWLVIVYRALKGKLFGPNKDASGLVMFYTLSAILVVAFFGFGLFYGRGSHLTVADYWRWFVVHIWVEGIFEFFGVAIIALFMVALGLVDKLSAMKVAYLTAILVFASGLIGTAHHYFWYGGPSYWLILGSVFASLEPIPLILLVVRGWMEYKTINDAGKDYPYRWPLMFLTASAFWNFLGAGVFGFMINLPVVNYYEHATYLTANHGHAALFGVYGMLSIALLLFSWRGLVKTEFWNDKFIKVIFYLLNGGLLIMTLGMLLPIGIAQTVSSYKNGLWAARSADFYNTPLVQWLGFLRIIPDTIVIIGALLLLFFLVTTYFKLKPTTCKVGDNVFQGKDCEMI